MRNKKPSAVIRAALQDTFITLNTLNDVIMELT